MTVTDEELLMTVVNSAPVVDGDSTDALAGLDGDAFVARLGGRGGSDEAHHLRLMRDAVHAVIRGDHDATGLLDSLLVGASMTPRARADGIRWELQGPADQQLAFRFAEAWSRVTAAYPGRLRPCANTECNLFLLDRSRPGTAKWCSMATCGNRMKARAHASRHRAEGVATGG